MRNKKSNKGTLPRKNEIKVHQWGWFLMSLRWIVGIFVAYYLGTLGPIWPTEPEIRPNRVGANNPFDIPFSVTNKSVLFDIKNPVFDCWATYIRMTRNNYISDSVARARGRTIPAGTTTQQTCMFKNFISSSLGRNTETIAACIRISAKYEKRGPFSNTVSTQLYQWHPELKPKVWLLTDKCK